jgi:hypothetical protein
LAGAGVVHANIGFGIASGMFNEPHYLGATWSALSLWIGAGVYLLASVLLGYFGWRLVPPPGRIEPSSNSALGQPHSPQRPKMR